MPADIYFTRPPMPPGGLIVPETRSYVEIASLGPMRPGSYIVFAKVIVVTRVDSSGRDSALAQFSLQSGRGRDDAMTTLWHSSDQGSLQPADTVSLLLPVRITPLRSRSGTPPPPRRVRLYCKSTRGILELRDIVIAAIRGDSITDLTGR